jgi:DNA-directed RNA polymerase subunit M/transcription elongation factor TFIIS
MLIHKHCPKCRGNMYTSGDYYGKYEQCLQCGYTHDLDSTEQKSPVARVKEAAVAI